MVPKHQSDAIFFQLLTMFNKDIKKMEIMFFSVYNDSHKNFHQLKSRKFQENLIVFYFPPVTMYQEPPLKVHLTRLLVKHITTEIKFS